MFPIFREAHPHSGGEAIISPNAVDNVVQILRERAPSYPRCGDTPQEANYTPTSKQGAQGRRRPFDEAVASRYWQANPRNRIGLITLDIDSSRPEDDPINRLIRGEIRAVPTLATYNNASGHPQLIYAITDPVGYGGRSRSAPQRLLEAVWDSLTGVWNADQNFTRDLSRGPLAPGHTLEVLSGKTYELRELAALIDLPRQRRIDPAMLEEARHADSRNCAMFDYIGRIGRRHAHLSYHALTLLLTEKAEQYQEALQQHPRGPMPPQEAAYIVRRVADWCHSHRDSLSAPMPGAVDRSRQHSRERQPAAPEAIQKARQQESGRFTADRRREATRAELKAAVVTLQTQGQPVTAKNLMIATGLSKNTVYAHSDIWN